MVRVLNGRRRVYDSHDKHIYRPGRDTPYTLEASTQSEEPGPNEVGRTCTKPKLTERTSGFVKEGHQRHRQSNLVTERFKLLNLFLDPDH